MVIYNTLFTLQNGASRTSHIRIQWNNTQVINTVRGPNNKLILFFIIIFYEFLFGRVFRGGSSVFGKISRFGGFLLCVSVTHCKWFHYNTYHTTVIVCLIVCFPWWNVCSWRRGIMLYLFSISKVYHRAWYTVRV